MYFYKNSLKEDDGEEGCNEDDDKEEEEKEKQHIVPFAATKLSLALCISTGPALLPLL